jgi:hypothetical protein
MLAVELGLTSNDAPFLYTALPKSYISCLCGDNRVPEKTYRHMFYSSLNINS